MKVTGDSATSFQVILEPGDGVLAHGFAKGGVLGFSDLAEDCALVTLTAGPGLSENNVEIYIPVSLSARFRDAIGRSRQGITKL